MHLDAFRSDLQGFHVWRQTQTQMNIAAFSQDTVSIFQPRVYNLDMNNGALRMEFPLMQWLISRTTSTDNVLNTRLWIFIIWILTIVGFSFFVGRISKEKSRMFLAAPLVLFSPLVYYYCVNPLPDHLALCFFVWALYCFEKGREKTFYLLLTLILLSLATLCKLPFGTGYLLFAPWFFNWIKSPDKAKGISIIAIGSISLLFPLWWYATVIPEWTGNGVVQGVFDNGIPFTTYLDIIQHHLISGLPEMYVGYGAFLLFLVGLWVIYKKRHLLFTPHLSYTLVAIGGIIYVLLELNMIGKEHDYYLFPLIPFVWILVSEGAGLVWKKNKAITLVFFVLLPVTSYLRLHHRWDEASPGFEADLLLHKHEIARVIPTDAIVTTGSDASPYVHLYHIGRKGYAFNAETVHEDDLVRMLGRSDYLVLEERAMELFPDLTDEKNCSRFGKICVVKIKPD
jgi:hypothetical protein